MSELPTCAKEAFRGPRGLDFALYGPRIHLSAPAYMPSCIRPEVRLPLDQQSTCFV